MKLTALLFMTEVLVCLGVYNSPLGPYLSTSFISLEMLLEIKNTKFSS